MSYSLQPQRLYSPWNSPDQNTGVGSLSILQWIFLTQGSSPTLQAKSLAAEPAGKPKNTGVGSLSLLQWIFPTQESNSGLPHCRQILYQLTYQQNKINHFQNNTKARKEIMLCYAVLSHSIVSDSLRSVDCSPPGSSVHGIFQARKLEWFAIPALKWMNEWV